MSDEPAFAWEHILYRLFSRSGALLYIGRQVDPSTRRWSRGDPRL